MPESDTQPTGVKTLEVGEGGMTGAELATSAEQAAEVQLLEAAARLDRLEALAREFASLPEAPPEGMSAAQWYEVQVRRAALAAELVGAEG